MPELPPLPATASETRPAGFWRRLAAFLVDGLILGAIGLLVGLLASDALSQMGGYERLIGFAIALAYAGVLNSRVGEGKTLGKRALGIRVRNIDGGLLSLPRAMARQVVFSVPFFLNGAPFGESVLLSFWGVLLSLVLFGGMLSTFYLFLFNRKTRRCLHDMASGSYVVRDGDLPPSAPVPRLWRGHAVVLAIIFVVSASVPLVAQRFVSSETFAPLLAINGAVKAEPGVLSASTMDGTSYRSGAGNKTYLAVTVNISSRLVNDEERARALAKRIIALHPEAASRDSIVIVFVHGYDMVISSSWRSHQFAFSPKDLD